MEVIFKGMFRCVTRGRKRRIGIKKAKKISKNCHFCVKLGEVVRSGEGLVVKFSN